MGVLIRSEQTDRAFAVLEQVLQPRKLIKPHTHAANIWVYPIDAEVGVLISEKVMTVRPGTWVVIPHDVLHAMWNPGDQPVRVMEIITPGGSERWFEEVSALADADTGGFAAACARYGMAFFPDSPWTAELRDRFGLMR